jgi:hypothetical protein
VEILAIVPNLVSRNVVSRQMLKDLREVLPDKVTPFEATGFASNRPPSRSNRPPLAGSGWGWNSAGLKSV